MTETLKAAFETDDLCMSTSANAPPPMTNSISAKDLLSKTDTQKMLEPLNEVRANLEIFNKQFVDGVLRTKLELHNAINKYFGPGND